MPFRFFSTSQMMDAFNNRLPSRPQQITAAAPKISVKAKFSASLSNTLGFKTSQTHLVALLKSSIQSEMIYKEEYELKLQRDSHIFAKRLDSRLETYAKEVDKKVSLSHQFFYNLLDILSISSNYLLIQIDSSLSPVFKSLSY